MNVSEGTCECLGGLCEVLFGSVRGCVVLGGIIRVWENVQGSVIIP